MSANLKAIEPDYSHLRRKVNGLINYRNVYRPHDKSDVVVTATPQMLHRALGYPPPMPGEEYPDHVNFRTYRVVAVAPRKPARFLGRTW